jgi:hypothetical protein
LPLDETEPLQPFIKRDMVRRTAWTTEQATEAINPARFLRARRAAM